MRVCGGKGLYDTVLCGAVKMPRRFKGEFQNLWWPGTCGLICFEFSETQATHSAESGRAAPRAEKTHTHTESGIVVPSRHHHE